MSIIPMNGFGTTERFIEIPWCLFRCGAPTVALDVGYANADADYLQALGGMRIPQLYGLDLVPPRPISITDAQGDSRPLLTPVQGDIRTSPFSEGMFDLILCIFTIEHVGLDNSRYEAGGGAGSACGDFDAIHELYRICGVNGRLLMTVPFGKYENHGWFQQYDFDRLMRLVTCTSFHVEQADFFRYRNGWHECMPSELRDTGYQSNGAPNAAGLACLELVKTGEPLA